MTKDKNILYIELPDLEIPDIILPDMPVLRIDEKNDQDSSPS